MKGEEQARLEESRVLLQRDGLGGLFTVLRQGVYHLTSVQGYTGIRRDRYIKPNDGSFPNTYPQLANSYGRHHGYVSLFDFESPTEEQCFLQRSKWEGFFTRHKPATVLIRFNRGQLASELISYECAIKEVGFRMMKIPHVEVWYPKPIPFSYATGLVLITPTKPIRFEIFDSDEEGLQRFERKLEAASELNIQGDTESKLASFLRSVTRDKHS